MTDDPLYPTALLRLAADATGAGRLAQADAVGTAHNPACGDRVRVELALDGGRIAALAHQTQACVLAQASASLLAGTAPGQDRAALAALADGIRSMLAGGPMVAGYEAFAGVAGHAGRHSCVLLPLQAAMAALEPAEEGAVGSQRQVGAIQGG
jgi:NifU-like protein involved in Fe-S cluster formation